ncbi:minor capsid protein [Streptomyces nitrosporeus]|uniref:minor capsid protein n=1 Tax=Streptomyces nitrosporeus TaxID=28894 RepID=UPI0039A0462B
MTRARVQWSGDEAARAMHAAAARGLRLGTEHVLQVSRARVPIEEGTLERSGTATVDEDELTGAIAYDTPYAVRQHEEMDYRHDAGRTAKYLELPMAEEGTAVGEIIAAQVRRALR